MTPVDDRVDKAAEAAEAARVERARSRAAAVVACRAIEASLVRALGGGRLHGLPNLGTGSHPYRAVRLRAEHVDERLEAPHGTGTRGPEALVLDDWGQLAFARLVRRGGLHVENRPATDDELRVEDAEALGEVAVTVLEEHAYGVQASAERFAELRAVAERLNRALDGALPTIHWLEVPTVGPATTVGVTCGEAYTVASTDPAIVTCEACKRLRRAP